MSGEQHKLLIRARKKAISIEEVYESLQTECFFGVLFGEDIDFEEILPAFYMRQSAEQIFDIAKNYTNLFPLRDRKNISWSSPAFLRGMLRCQNDLDTVI